MHCSSSSSQTTDSASLTPDSTQTRIVDVRLNRATQAQAAGPPEEDPDSGYESEREGPLASRGEQVEDSDTEARRVVYCCCKCGVDRKDSRKDRTPLSSSSALPSGRLNPLVLAAGPSFISEASAHCIQQQPQRYWYWCCRRLPSQTTAFTSPWYGLAFSYLSSPLCAPASLHPPNEGRICAA